MTLPRAIQRQVDEAAAAEAAIAQQAQQPTGVLTDPSQLSYSPEPSQEAPVPTVQSQPSEDWQHKYKSLQGMFAQKTGELQTQNRQYESQMSQMQKQLDNLLQTRKAEEAREKTVADPQDVESFGADMIEMVKRYSERVFQSMAEQFGGKASELDTRLTALEHQVTGVSTRTDSTLEQQFYATLNTVVPDWETVNQDPRWLAWLAEMDPVYGTARQAALDFAHKNMDVQRVVSVFKAFKTANPVKARSSLENQIAPNGAASPSPVAPAAKQILAAKFVEKFYNDLAKGRYASNEAEATRIEAEINQAAAEGRIR